MDIKEKTYLERMQSEHSELRERIEKLKAFIMQNSMFSCFTQDKHDLMKGQLHAMELYDHFLSRRIQMEQKK